MRKILIILVISMLAVSAFAQGLEMSAGAGVGYFYTHSKLKADAPVGDTTNTNPAITIGAFFDATYVQVGVDYSFTLDGKSKDDSGTTTIDDRFTFLSFEILGKYPVLDTGSVTVFPMIGFEQFLNLTAKDKDGNDLDLASDMEKHLNMSYIKLGVGADFDISDSMFIRANLLGGYKLKSEMEKDLLDTFDTAGIDATWNTFALDVSVSAGYRF